MNTETVDRTAEARHVALADLALSDLNPRQTADPEGIAALAASIRTVGLMQNLAGFAASEGSGIQIVAGGRRLRALQLLADTGEAPEFVPVLVTNDPETARLWANTENTAREALHPADEIRAYYRMLTEGNASIAQVASAFAVTEAHVRRRVRLGALPDAALDALKAGAITIGQAQILTIAQDESLIVATVEKIADASYPGYYSENELRRMVTPDSIRPTDRRLKFVGRDAYDRAGGKSTVDLFEDTTVLHSADVLDRIFAEKLDEEATKAEQSGWKWAKTSPDSEFDHAAYRGFGRLYPVEGELTEAQAERYDELAELAEGDALDEAGHEELDGLQTILDGCFTEEQHAVAGIVLHVNWSGQLVATMGLVDPADMPEAVAAGLAQPSAHNAAASDADGGAASDDTKTAISQTLVDDLHRVAKGARQHAALLRNPDLLIDLLAYQLSHGLAWRKPFGISTEDVPNWPTTEADGYALDDRLTSNPPADMYGKDLAKSFRAWRKKGAEHIRAELARMLASLYRGGTDELAALIDKETTPNIREVWTPTVGNFLGRVNVAYLETLLADLTGCDTEAGPFKAFAKMKKKEKADMLARIFAGDAETLAAWHVTAARKAAIDAWVPDTMK